MTNRSPYDGEPYYCTICNLGYSEYAACEQPDCRLEAEGVAQARKAQHADRFKTFAPEPPAKIRDDPTPGFTALTTVEMVYGENMGFPTGAAPDHMDAAHATPPEPKREPIKPGTYANGTIVYGPSEFPAFPYRIRFKPQCFSAFEIHEIALFFAQLSEAIATSAVTLPSEFLDKLEKELQCDMVGTCSTDQRENTLDPPKPDS